MGKRIDPGTNKHIQQEQSEQRFREREEYERRIKNGEEPWRESAGVMSVMEAVRDCDFPCTFDQLRQDIGKREVITSKGHGHTVADLLDIVEARLDPEKDPLMGDWSVPSIRDFQSILERHWEAVRYDDIPDEQKPAHGGGQPQNPRSHG